MPSQHQDTLTGEITEFVQDVSHESLPANVIRRAKEAVIDGIGVMLAGHHTDCATLIRRYIGELKLRGPSTVIGEATAWPAEYAALANAMKPAAMLPSAGPATVDQ